MNVNVNVNPTPPLEDLIYVPIHRASIGGSLHTYIHG